LRLCLAEPHCWPFCPERLEPHGYSGYFCSWAACIFQITSGPPNVGVDVVEITT
jgi:hypothetical protein